MICFLRQLKSSLYTCIHTSIHLYLSKIKEILDCSTEALPFKAGATLGAFSLVILLVEREGDPLVKWVISAEGFIKSKTLILGSYFMGNEERTERCSAILSTVFMATQGICCVLNSGYLFQGQLTGKYSPQSANKKNPPTTQNPTLDKGTEKGCHLSWPCTEEQGSSADAEDQMLRARTCGAH